MKAADIMTRRVITIHGDDSVHDAARLMIQDNISGLPVVDRDGRPVGMVTEGDLLRRAEIGTEVRRPRWLELLVGPGVLAGDYARSHARRVSEVMTDTLVSVEENTELTDVVRLMERHHVKRILVLRDGKIAGLLSRSNLLQALADALPEPQPSAASDESIRARIQSEIAALHWKPSTSINPIVQDGEVDLHGVIYNDQEGEALRVLCENIPGVTRVRDHLVWIDPYSGFVVERGTDEPPSSQQGQKQSA